MDTFNLIFIVLIIVGFFIIIISLILINKTQETGTPIEELDEAMKKIKNTIDQADLTMDDLNFLSERVLQRFDEKQKELVFLYGSMDGKDIELSESVQEEPEKPIIDIKSDEEIPISKVSNVSRDELVKIHPLFPEIRDSLMAGESVPKIAKSLNMGQGEVQFIMGLGKEFLWKNDMLF